MARPSQLLLLAALALTGCAPDDRSSASEPADLRGAPPLVTPIRAATNRPLTRPTTSPVGPLEARPQPYIFHLPGVAGTSGIDYNLRNGLQAGGFDGPFEFFDWTCQDPGIPALHNRARNLEQAKILADKIAAQRRQHPDQPIYLVSHSGGAGPAVWALEALPAGVQVDCLVLLAPALSPKYDLSKALAHVKGKAFVFHSLTDDLVLGTGTKLFGTIDGVRTDAAGRVGFARPEGADAAQYEKLVSRPYEAEWARFGHIGGHMGSMAASFARAIVAPVMSGRTPTAQELEDAAAKAVKTGDAMWWPR